MRWLRFSHVFVVLMAMALVSVLALPNRQSNTLRATVQMVFLTQPVRAFASSLTGMLRRSPHPDIEAPGNVTRTYHEIVEENRAMRVALAHLAGQLEQLREISADRQALASLKQYCRPMQVTGGDAGLRRSLIIQGRMDGLRPGMAVIHAGGLVGRLDRVGWAGGAQVQLVTDRAFRTTVRFVQFRGGRVSPVPDLTGLLEGDGRDGMMIRNIPMRSAEGKIAAGDFVVIGDREFPQLLQSYRIGEIVSIAPSRDYALFAEITVRPLRDLQKLREVMVFNP
jgi:hypothetical protein